MTNEWSTMTRLFDVMRTMAAKMVETIPEPYFNVARGIGTDDSSNSPKWIIGHLALGMDMGLSLLGETTDAITIMWPLYGPGSPGGVVDDSLTRDELLLHFQSVGDALKEKVAMATPGDFDKPNETPFLTTELPTCGDLLAHVFTTHIALHAGQLSQICRELGLPSLYHFS